jgi:AAA15 family ATPase/GTPase
MIEKIELLNFKGFKRLRIDQLSRITLLGGENSVGKTSILEAIFMFFDRANAELLLRQFTWRGINKLYLSTEQMFSPLFHDYDRNEDITIVLTIDGKEEKLRLHFSEKMPERRVIFERWDKRHKTAGTEERAIVNGKMDVHYIHAGHDEKSELIITERGLKLRDERAKPERRPAAYLSPRVPATPSEDSQRFGELDRRGQVDGAIEYLKSFDSRIVGLSSIFYGDSAIMHADIGISQKVPVPQLGEGLAFALSMYLAMSAAKDGTLLVDEIGSGVHHSIMPKFWNAISGAADHFNCQLIGTTHSYECMDAATKGLRSLSEPKFTYIRLDRDKEEIVPNIYSYPLLEAAISSGWEVR